MATTTREDELLEQARDVGWYHTLELRPGHVVRGMFDMRRYADAYGLPERMDGMRVLDVGTWDGFWAWEMEKRGADVVALDLDDVSELDYPPRRRPKVFDETPRGTGFRIAHELFGSKVERVSTNLYRATPEELGTFDLVFTGFVLIHMRDQLLALERIAHLCRGTLIIGEEFHKRLSRLPLPLSRYHGDRDKDMVFWLPNKACWRAMVRSAGFDHVEEFDTFTVKSEGDVFEVPQYVLHASQSVHHRS
jgi:tRNA (mo5U34)-methyltransferase